LRRSLFLQDIQSYYDYFDSLWGLNPKTTTVGDITPSYAGLNHDHFAEIKKNLLIRSFVPKIIFILRDPVERIISAAKMYSRRSLWSNHSLQEIIQQNYKTFHFQSRTRYDLTIADLEKVFDEKSLFYGLFEDLFGAEANLSGSISKFLGIDDILDTQKKYNVSSVSQQLDDDTISQVASFYSEVYRFAQSRFAVKNKWLGYNYL